MDKLAERLKTDAERIEVEVSEELDKRIEASLRGVTPKRQRNPVVTQRSAGFWWASSLTGIAAAFVVIAIVNTQSQPEVHPDRTANISPVTVPRTMPAIDWQAESAMLTSPLRQELEDLQSDIKKAEQKLRDDIGL